jgi:hypothetical protein
LFDANVDEHQPRAEARQYVAGAAAAKLSGRREAVRSTRSCPVDAKLSGRREAVRSTRSCPVEQWPTIMRLARLRAAGRARG